MTLGLGTLRLAPDIFWRMTLPELAAAARAARPEDQGAMGREELTEMMTRFPDACRNDGREATGK